ncbi:MAG: hypothetical protein GKS06_15870 [Acidobacteria bacterium]|nr:hypothetical protein [Acidobacteriota bacterium]
MWNLLTEGQKIDAKVGPGGAFLPYGVVGLEEGRVVLERIPPRLGLSEQPLPYPDPEDRDILHLKHEKSERRALLLSVEDGRLVLAGIRGSDDRSGCPFCWFEGPMYRSVYVGVTPDPITGKFPSSSSHHCPGCTTRWPEGEYESVVRRYRLERP